MAQERASFIRSYPPLAYTLAHSRSTIIAITMQRRLLPSSGVVVALALLLLLMMMVFVVEGRQQQQQQQRKPAKRDLYEGTRADRALSRGLSELLCSHARLGSMVLGRLCVIVLGIPRDATEKQIRRAFRTKAPKLQYALLSLSLSLSLSSCVHHDRGRYIELISDILTLYRIV